MGADVLIELCFAVLYILNTTFGMCDFKIGLVSRVKNAGFEDEISEPRTHDLGDPLQNRAAGG